MARTKKNKGILAKNEIKRFRKPAVWHRYFPEGDVTKLTSRFINQLGDYKGQNKNFSRLILSDESLCQWGSADASYDHCATYDPWPVGSKPKRQGKREGPIPFAQFLREHFRKAWEPYGDVYVVVTLRNQSDYLGSLYAQRSRLRRNASQMDFENQVKEILEKGDPSIDWNGLVEDFEEAVGQDNLTVLFFEEIGEPEFWDDLIAALGTQEKPSLRFLSEQSPRENMKSAGSNSWNLQPSKVKAHKVIDYYWPSQIPGKKFAVRKIRRILNPLVNPFMERNRENQIHISERLRLHIRKHCIESNQRLALRLNRDLESLGY